MNLVLPICLTLQSPMAADKSVKSKSKSIKEKAELNELDMSSMRELIAEEVGGIKAAAN